MSDETDKTADTPAEGDKGVSSTEDKSEPEQQVEGAEGSDEAGGDENKGDEGQADKPKKPSGAQRAKRREQHLLNELSVRERELEELRRRVPGEPSGADKDEPPKEEDFNGDWTAFVAARAAYEAGKAVDKRLEARERSEIGRRQIDVQRERDLAHLDRIEEAREVIPDWDQTMAKMKGVTVRDAVIEEIKSSDKSHLLSYHLAQNPEKLRELNSMSDRELAREIGRLEATLKMPEAKKKTSAPPPGTTLRGGGAAPSFDPAKADMAEYAANYAKRQAAKAK